MILATSQDITNATVIQDGTAGQFIDDTIDYTFDTNWHSGIAFASTQVEFNPGDNYTYVGIAGHNIGSMGATITISNHDVDELVAYAPIDDRPIMIEVTPRSGGSKDLFITITKANVSDSIIITHVAAGQSTDFTSTTTSGQIITRDYSAGYPRIPMNRARKSKVTLNQSAAPTATLIRTVSQKVRLNIANVATNFAQDELLEYQTFWTENAFFIQNDDDLTQTYIAMQFIPIAPSTHGSTRELVNLGYSFTAYNGL